ncbi:hypothetical protein TNCV_1047211 [Trichonephila clavipes]|nr:hypothetical protein TNCV_1047211 [Trichonephila clavipes]
MLFDGTYLAATHGLWSQHVVDPRHFCALASDWLDAENPDRKTNEEEPDLCPLQLSFLTLLNYLVSQIIGL